ncbi:antibiotic biosynthesis monooxygenase [Streptomyces sp. NPDC086787]|uniref:antibiotic biosynthesis monooxygenase n=1 Tax=Streptomyces sp. NPDC086787 TaxID=3365759 RepID=UPI0037FB26BF
MFVRTVYATGDPAKIDTALRALNSEGRDLLEERPGYRGSDVLTDRELGKLFVVSWWDSEQARRNSDEVMRERRADLLEPFAATLAVENYEAAVCHTIRMPRAAGGLRLTRLEFDPVDTDLLVDAYRAGALPRIEMLPGLARTSLFTDRERGRGTVSALFTDRESMTAARTALADVRCEAAAKTHATVTALEEFDIVHADVRPD